MRLSSLNFVWLLLSNVDLQKLLSFKYKSQPFLLVYFCVSQVVIYGHPKPLYNCNILIEKNYYGIFFQQPIVMHF